ncbi:MAG TPA: hypothetical protein VFL91_25605 [Thermomicrobiales bacterium]|nr:hypothetical protein [Thermomicrobiales bacterium]
MAISKANYIKGSSPRIANLTRTVHYYTWRGAAADDAPRMTPREWRNHRGRALHWRAVREQVREYARHYRYAYRIVLSTAATPLAGEDYGEVLGARFPRWYLVMHHDGDHPHAHVIAFTDRLLSPGDLAGQRRRLAARERERGRPRAAARGRGDGDRPDSTP